jgi:transposase-like protein
MAKAKQEAGALARLARQAKWSRADGKRVIEAWTRSGLTIRAFSDRHGLKDYKISWWKRELNKQARRPVSDAPNLAAVTALAPAVVIGEQAPSVVVRCPGGIAIEIGDPAHVAPSWVSEAVRSLSVLG